MQERKEMNDAIQRSLRDAEEVESKPKRRAKTSVKALPIGRAKRSKAKRNVQSSPVVRLTTPPRTRSPARSSPGTTSTSFIRELSDSDFELPTLEEAVLQWKSRGSSSTSINSTPTRKRSLEDRGVSSSSYTPPKRLIACIELDSDGEIIENPPETFQPRLERRKSLESSLDDLYNGLFQL
ncbi:hypothetical protein V5O48_014264 [Marasmius crinis-equi]|uniref:Uncharacterized protein n=1 Tax=Marasmius crinis-equi TaxID=585013 RepID=A0ABR3EXW2_9AGAR